MVHIMIEEPPRITCSDRRSVTVGSTESSQRVHYRKIAMKATATLDLSPHSSLLRTNQSI